MASVARMSKIMANFGRLNIKQNIILSSLNHNYISMNHKWNKYFSTSSEKDSIVSDTYKPRMAYSVATKANGFIFVSGQLGTHTDKLDTFVSDTIEGQTEQVLNKKIT